MPGDPETVRRTLWLFDVDGTLVDSFDGRHLRPLVVELFEALHRAGASIAVWSAGGVDHAARLLDMHGIAGFVSNVAHKRVGTDGRWIAPAFIEGDWSITYVDDQPAQLPERSDRIVVFPYLGPNEHDRALKAALVGLADTIR